MNLFEQWEADVENIVINDNGIGFNDDITTAIKNRHF